MFDESVHIVPRDKRRRPNPPPRSRHRFLCPLCDSKHTIERLHTETGGVWSFCDTSSRWWKHEWIENTHNLGVSLTVQRAFDTQNNTNQRKISVYRIKSRIYGNLFSLRLLVGRRAALRPVCTFCCASYVRNGRTRSMCGHRTEPSATGIWTGIWCSYCSFASQQQQYTNRTRLMMRSYRLARVRLQPATSVYFSRCCLMGYMYTVKWWRRGIWIGRDALKED